MKALKPQQRRALGIVVRAKVPPSTAEVDKRGAKEAGKHVALFDDLNGMVPKYLDKPADSMKGPWVATERGAEIIVNCDAAVWAATLPGGGK